MSAATEPFFILSSGRSGTKLMEKIFSAYDEVDMHHEYMVHHIQPAAVKYQLGIANRHEVSHVLKETHRAAVYYSRKALWGDSSNKLTWVIDILAEIFPNARFIHLARDGRKVASSYFHKLKDECYDDEATAALARYIDQYPAVPAPPPEKRYWWPQPRRGALLRSAFKGYGQFERIAYHWAESHRVINDQLAKLPAERQIFIRLEDLTTSPSEAARLLAFLGLEPKADLGPILARPHNVNRPEDKPLTAEEALRFSAIAGETMRLLGYHRRAEYVVNY